MAEPMCDRVQMELSVARDTGGVVSADLTEHVAGCADCAAFRDGLERLDLLLAKGDFTRTPDLTDMVMASLRRPASRLWALAAVAVVGLIMGTFLGLRLDVVHAQDLSELFHAASPTVEGLRADLFVVERGWHPEVPERVYTGRLAYSAPERLEVDLLDTTAYPDERWIPNDVHWVFADGDLLATAASRCPVAALPDCQTPPSTTAVRDQRPFDSGVLNPLELVGPGRSLNWWSGIEVLGTPTLDGPTIQISTTVAAVDLIEALVQRGGWRELHPTDPVLMWLDEETLAPVRIEVRAAATSERGLWQLRRGYADQPEGEPILIIEMTGLVAEAQDIEPMLPVDARSGGFSEGAADVPEPALESRFEVHRSGRWALPDGGLVDVRSWSDGRSWLMIEVARGWSEPRLFGLTSPFARRVELDDGSVAYLDPAGGAVALHTGDLDVLVSGSVPETVLLATAATLGLEGRPVPDQWEESSVVEVEGLPEGTLVADPEGWSILGRVDNTQTTLQMTGAGSRTVVISQTLGDHLDPPIGPDFVAVDLRGVTGRFNTSSGTLEWVESGRVVVMRSETVGMDELVRIAEAMRPR
ncbi:MAG: hypothetical protein L0Z47_02985 [Actinobacteria bacterium]|nr:hypothetical protein [Actinomycetota bacterium]